MPVYEFICDKDEKGCGESTTLYCSYDDLPEKTECEHCKLTDHTRRSFGLGMIKTTYEMNGRKAVQINLSDGTVTRRSMTRQNVLDGKGTKSVLTKGYQEHVTKVEKVKKVTRERQLQKQIFGKVIS